MKKIRLLIISSLIIIFIYSFRISFTPKFAGHHDNYWYLQVAKNFAQGKGLVDNTITFFYPQFDQIPHTIGDFWNPLGIIISGYIFKIFGFSDFVNKAQTIFIVYLLSVFIFFYCMKVYQDNLIAFFSSIIFAVHQFSMSIGVGGIIPETYHLLFNTLFFYISALSIVKDNKFFLVAGVLGGLAYLVRNESLFCCIVLVFIFFYKKYILKKEVSWKYLFLSIFLFLITILPWEIRNIILFGKEHNLSKYHILFAKDYYSMHAFYEAPSLLKYIKDYLSLGIKMIIVRKIQSYYYNLNWAAELMNWVILMFVPIGIIKSIKIKEYLPVYFYMVVTYFIMCFINSTPQSGVWYGSYTSLVFIISISVSGCFYFGELLSNDKNVGRKIGFLLCSFIFLYFLTDNFKVYYKLKKINFQNLSENYALEIDNWIKNNVMIKDPIVMTYCPAVINFYTGIKTVSIPSNGIDVVKKIIKKYNCDLLILYSEKPNDELAKLYRGEEFIPWLNLVYEKSMSTGLPEDGGKIKIYKIVKEKMDIE